MLVCICSISIIHSAELFSNGVFHFHGPRNKNWLLKIKLKFTIADVWQARDTVHCSHTPLFINPTAKFRYGVIVVVFFSSSSLSHLARLCVCLCMRLYVSCFSIVLVHSGSQRPNISGFQIPFGQHYITVDIYKVYTHTHTQKTCINKYIYIPDFLGIQFTTTQHMITAYPTYLLLFVQ